MLDVRQEDYDSAVAALKEGVRVASSLPADSPKNGASTESECVQIESSSLVQEPVIAPEESVQTAQPSLPEEPTAPQTEPVLDTQPSQSHEPAASPEESMQNTCPFLPQGETYKYEVEWESSDDALTLHISRSALFSPSQLPDDIVNRDVLDTNLPNLFFVFESKKYGVYCDLTHYGSSLYNAVWRVRRRNDVMIVGVVAVQTALPSFQYRGSIQRACDRR
mgnify:FL=1